MTDWRSKLRAVGRFAGECWLGLIAWAIIFYGLFGHFRMSDLNNGWFWFWVIVIICAVLAVLHEDKQKNLAAPVHGDARLASLNEAVSAARGYTSRQPLSQMSFKD